MEVSTQKYILGFLRERRVFANEGRRISTIRLMYACNISGLEILDEPVYKGLVMPAEVDYWTLNNPPLTPPKPAFAIFRQLADRGPRSLYATVRTLFDQTYAHNIRNLNGDLEAYRRDLEGRIFRPEELDEMNAIIQKYTQLKSRESEMGEMQKIIDMALELDEESKRLVLEMDLTLIPESWTNV